MLGAAVLAKLGRIGNKLRDHHWRMKEEGVGQSLTDSDEELLQC